MYILKCEKEEFKKILKDNGTNQRKISEMVGITEGFISQIISGKGTSKLSAFAICKSISPDFEIENLFMKI